MRIDDPQVLALVERLDDAADTLRRLAGFEPRFPTADTSASRAPSWCPEPDCGQGFRSKADLEHHLVHDHSRAVAAQPEGGSR